MCENNARLEKVDHQIQWVQSSASKLPFENDKFDVIVSCLTFHEVKDQLDKVQLFNEQLRVLKPSGQFIFMDLFLEKKIFGDYQTFINAISTKGVSSFEHIKLDQLIKIPKLLLSKKVLGNAVLIKAIKN